jgi:hypothetical protein
MRRHRHTLRFLFHSRSYGQSGARLTTRPMATRLADAERMKAMKATPAGARAVSAAARTVYTPSGRPGAGHAFFLSAKNSSVVRLSCR